MTKPQLTPRQAMWPVEVLGVHKRVTSALRRNDLEDLCDLVDEDLRIDGDGIGRGTVTDIHIALASFGLKPGMMVSHLRCEAQVPQYMKLEVAELVRPLSQIIRDTTVTRKLASRHVTQVRDLIVWTAEDAIRRLGLTPREFIAVDDILDAENLWWCPPTRSCLVPKDDTWVKQARSLFSWTAMFRSRLGWIPLATARSWQESRWFNVIGHIQRQRPEIQRFHQLLSLKEKDIRAIDWSACRGGRLSVDQVVASIRTNCQRLGRQPSL